MFEKTQRYERVKTVEDLAVETLPDDQYWDWVVYRLDFAGAPWRHGQS